VPSAPRSSAITTRAGPAQAAATAAPAGAAETDAERTSRLTRRRSALRLLFELFEVAALPHAAPLLQLLKDMVKEDAATSEPLHPNLSLFAAFAKQPARLAPRPRLGPACRHQTPPRRAVARVLSFSRARAGRRFAASEPLLLSRPARGGGSTPADATDGDDVECALSDQQQALR
jgi:hypothetical protein